MDMEGHALLMDHVVVSVVQKDSAAGRAMLEMVAMEKWEWRVNILVCKEQAQVCMYKVICTFSVESD